MEETEVLILGAGAAGMLCATEAARRGRRVLVVDHARAPGEKIRISGGGRCNFTNRSTAPDRFLSQNPKFIRSALSRFTPADFVALIDRAGIAWHEKTLGQLFCDGSATQVVRMLTGNMAEAGAELRLSTQIGEIGHDGARFRVGTSGGTILAERLVVATGGRSIPKMGATGLGHDIARRFGLRMTETRPALVPLALAEADLAWTAALSGVSIRARVACGRIGFDEALLFTHRGLSGPAILQISSYWREGQAISIDLAPGQDIRASLKERRAEGGRIAVHTALSRHLPERLAAALVARSGASGLLATRPNAEIDRLSEAVHRWQPRPQGSEGYRTAEVTLGGVDTRDIDSRTMEARTVPGLYFIGECVDVTGWLGGYNFQWAWSSGWAAGQAV